MFSAGGARCEEKAEPPFELVRSLRSTQDRIAHGDMSAFKGYRVELSQLADQFAQAGDETWKDPRNVRAAVALVLSGGDPRVLQPLVNQISGQEQVLARAALAYGQNRNSEALELLANVDARTLDPTIAGHIALVHAELMSKKDYAKTLVLLDDARLLAPGTMIEEAALRRQAALAVEQADPGRFESATTQYFRRFANSVHEINFRRQFAADVATRGMADGPEHRIRLETTMEALPAGQRQEVYLSIAWEGLKGGSVDLVRWAAANATKLAAEDSPQRLRSQLCEAAALIATDELDRGLELLKHLPAEKLNPEEAALLSAALRVAKQIRQELKPFDTHDERPKGAVEPPIFASVKSKIAQVDDLLARGYK